MNKLLPLLLCGASTLANATDFADNFSDQTLRFDYMLSADSVNREVRLAQLSKLPYWAGRQHNLDKMAPGGRAQFTLTDAATGDTIYRAAFSSLFLEWLDTPESASTPRSYQATVLAPMPLRPARATVDLLDGRLQKIASTTFTVNPSDILIAQKGENLPYSVTPLHISAALKDAIDVVILPEGYTAEEMPKFIEDAKVATESILSYEPFRSMADRFNFRAVEVPSQDSGVSVPRLGEWKSTPFGSHYSTLYSDRYLTTPNVFAVNDAAAAAPYEHIIILANTDEYGGGGILNDYTLTTAGHKNFRPVVVHEFGHSFGGLADEYFYDGDVMEDTYPTDVEPLEENVTTKVNFHGKWEHLVETGEADLIEGGAYSAKGVWRAADDCRMRTNTATEFCVACKLALEKLIRFYTE
jgi:hypothetical protein